MDVGRVSRFNAGRRIGAHERDDLAKDEKAYGDSRRAKFFPLVRQQLVCCWVANFRSYGLMRKHSVRLSERVARTRAR